MVKRTKIKKYYAFANIIIPNSHVSQQNIESSKFEPTKKGRKISSPAQYFLRSNKLIPRVTKIFLLKARR
ncbi:hypothetical protein QE382_002435 [Sphingobacterium zeae]|uniref:Uncharacterized protein n=1 Tax=Sphingobacterium zeae TaxID=1776859 RepID=A0ABU0U662_9SPHI|nr:hypothetical protein [Sphingobacterium zeae]